MTFLAQTKIKVIYTTNLIHVCTNSFGT
jgi:hypothetical protein